MAQNEEMPMPGMIRILSVLFTVIVIWAAPSQGAQRPNILFLVSDDQRADTIAAYGNPRIRTPNMDRLVRGGFNFRDTYCMGSIHGAVCQPSRAMFLSGRTLYRVPMDLKGVKILPQVLGEAGYVTFGTGKWHNGKSSFARGFQRGAAVFLGGMSNHLKVPLVDLKPDGTFTKRRIGEKFSSEIFADAAIDFLKSYRGDRPFFAYVSFTAPHDPRMPPEEFLRMYDPDRMKLPGNFLPRHPFNNGWMTGRDESLAPWPRTREVILNQLAEYYGMITHLDGQIGRLLDVLEATGRKENTVIVFTSDQGLALGSHGLMGKQNLYEHSMGTPLVFLGPGIPAGTSSALAYLYDIFPTLCDLAGLPVPGGVEGKSLAPVWRGEARSVRRSLFTTYEDLMRAVRDDRWKLIRYPRINRTQLFDLKNDPLEMKDLAEDPAQAGRIEAMMKLLRSWQEETGDRQPLTSENPESTEIKLAGRKRRPDPHQPDWIVRKYFGEDATRKGKGKRKGK